MAYEGVDMQTVDSSNLLAVGYDANDQQLYVSFRYNGAVYEYDDVPEDIYKGLLAASSHGTYFIYNVKDRFSYRVVS